MFQSDGQTLRTIYVIDAKRDVETNLHKITISKDAPISETGNFSYCLKLCEGSRVMLTKNMDVSDRLINGSIGTVVKIHRPAGSTNPTGVIFVKFVDPEAGNRTKSNRRQKELKDCVPIEVTSETFPVSKRMENKQFQINWQTNSPKQTRKFLTSKVQWKLKHRKSIDKMKLNKFVDAEASHIVTIKENYSSLLKHVRKNEHQTEMNSSL